MAEWHEQTALELGQAIGSGKIDPRDLARYFLARAEADPEGREIYMRLTRERAESEAAEAQERAKNSTRRSPLDGVPISWKDLFDSGGIATEGGSKLLEGRVPAKDAEVLVKCAEIANRESPTLKIPRTALAVSSSGYHGPIVDCDLGKRAPICILLDDS